MIYLMLIEILIAAVFLLASYFADRIITGKRLRENQSSWDNYCKDMTFSERIDCFADWILQRQYGMGWKHKYIPYMNHIEPTVFDCRIDGVQYRGTKEEISKHSGIQFYILNEFEILPMSIEIK